MFLEVPSKVDFPALERRILHWWDEIDAFQKLVEKNKGKKRWSFIDGPITANNPMGVHHAWGRTYKDLYHRYMAMQGHETRYQNGFDGQGLWIEVEVERELGFTSKRDIEKYGIGEFVERCKRWTLPGGRVSLRPSRRSNPFVWDTGWIGTTPTTLCPTRTTTPSGCSSGLVTTEGGSTKVAMCCPGVLAAARPSRSMRS